MSDRSAIEWTDATWNPVVAIDRTGKVGFHCEKVSPACEHCYAEAFNRRRLPARGTGLPYTRSSRDKVRIAIDEPTLLKPLKWRKSRRVFVESTSDLFADFVPFELIDRVFAVMELADWHTFQVLTKRPDRMAEYFETRHPSRPIDSIPPQWLHWLNDVHDETGRNLVTRYGRREGDRKYWPLSNIWLGATLEDQPRLEQRLPHLLRCPAKVRFISYEPALGPIDLRPVLENAVDCENCGPIFESRAEPDGTGGYTAVCPTCFTSWEDEGSTVCGCDPHIHWVIGGGESGSNARPSHIGWFQVVRDQCDRVDVPFFFKQWGEWCPGDESTEQRLGVLKCQRRGSPESLVQFIGPKGDVVFRVGKKAAGRILDGVEHSEFPQSAVARI